MSEQLHFEFDRPRFFTRGKEKRELVFIDDYSESAWKSLVVKALRIGWLTGLEKAASKVSPSSVTACLLCSVFEDVFPAISELEAVIAEAKTLALAKLCARQTHHGRGLTPRFCDLETQAVAAAETSKGLIYAMAREYKLWLPPRSLNCFWTWKVMTPRDAGMTRDVDTSPWRGMPSVMLDGHTFEGKLAGTKVTLLSGHYHNHRHLAERVASEGWASIRREALAAIDERSKARA